MFLKCFGKTSSPKRPYPTVIEELCHHFSLTDLRNSTNDFDQNCRIGQGGFGIVYKGYLQQHYVAPHYTVAVKRFRNGRVEQFKNEVELLCQLRHPNIISLIGFCNHEDDKIIVYEYMSNGSLEQHLQRGELSWKKRLEIFIGAARGLHYLHAGAKRTIIHRDIKPKTIVLDDNMEPKLTGFGLSVQGQRFMSKPKPIKVDILAGTLGYIPLEYIRDNIISDKTDVYSFGVLLLVVVCGGDALTLLRQREVLEEPMEENIDPKIKGKIAPECWQVFIDITQRCVKKYEADERPTMGEVEVELEHALALQEQADITNTNGDYALLSTTIIDWGVEPETNTYEGSDTTYEGSDTDSEENVIM